MKNYVVLAVVFAAFSFGFSELYSPEAWFCFRNDTLVFSAGVSENTGDPIYYELIQKNSEGKSTTLFSKTIRPAAEEKEWTVEFTGIKKDVVGKDALWLQETVGNGKGKSKLYGPYGYIKSALPETCDTALDGRDLAGVENFKLDSGQTYKFAYNKQGLVIILGDAKDDLTISLDPANGKTAFLAFSNRIITYNTDKTIAFLYPDREVVARTTAVQYKVRDWEGEMKVSDSASEKIITIPWFDLGMKYESGRKIGYMIHSDNFSYPAGASQYSPASWGNLIFK